MSEPSDLPTMFGIDPQTELGLAAEHPPTLPPWAYWPPVPGSTDPMAGAHPDRCRSCTAIVWWAKTVKHGAWNPLNHQPEPTDQPTTSHFATCPNASAHRRKAE